MAETNDYNESLASPEQPDDDLIKKPKKERVGDILHKERVTRRITLETIAKDLKLNVKYIKAIESNSFTDLPADPYVRVYLRSIATYLMLDPEEILKKFFDERGIPLSEVAKEKPEKIKINVEKDNERRSKSWVIIIIVIGILATVSYMQQKGMFAAIHKKKPVPAVDTTIQEESDIIDSLYAPDSTLEDSLEEETDSTEELGHHEKIDNTITPTDSLNLVINALYDSVWVQVFCDGSSWKNFILSGEPRVFKAADSINLHVGNHRRLKYILNGKTLALPGRGVKVFKIDHDGIELWKMSKWKSVFKKRL